MDNATTFEQMTETEFFERFKPVQNTITNGQSCYNGCMFETFGAEYEAVREAFSREPMTVWTLLEGDDGELYIKEGFHFVNRMGYFITQEPAPKGVSFEIYDEQIFDSEDVEPFEQCAQRPTM